MVAAHIINLLIKYTIINHIIIPKNIPSITITDVPSIPKNNKPNQVFSYEVLKSK